MLGVLSGLAVIPFAINLKIMLLRKNKQKKFHV